MAAATSIQLLVRLLRSGEWGLPAQQPTRWPRYTQHTHTHMHHAPHSTRTRTRTHTHTHTHTTHTHTHHTHTHTHTHIIPTHFWIINTKTKIFIWDGTQAELITQKQVSDNFSEIQLMIQFNKLMHHPI